VLFSRGLVDSSCWVRLDSEELWRTGVAVAWYRMRLEQDAKPLRAVSVLVSRDEMAAPHHRLEGPNIQCPSMEPDAQRKNHCSGQTSVCCLQAVPQPDTCAGDVFPLSTDICNGYLGTLRRCASAEQRLERSFRREPDRASAPPQAQSPCDHDVGETWPCSSQSGSGRLA
jgi:hypothetical protein